MLRIALEHFLHERGRLHVRGNIAARVRRAQQRERVEAGPVDVIGILRVQLLHRERVAPVAIVLIAVAE
jgi:hypothetical protein